MALKRRSYSRPSGTSNAEDPPAEAGVDRGWAWIVCLGSHLAQLLTTGYLSALGVLYIEWKEYFDATATASSWLLSLPWLVSSPCSPIVGALSPRLGIRRVAMVGGMLTALSTILGSLSKEMWQLYLCSVLSGVGLSMTVTPVNVVLTQYFKKRYALANGLGILGVNVGQMAFPPLFRVLIANFGWQGAMFIVGAIQMNSVVASALFRPLKAKPSTRRLTNLEMEVMDTERTVETHHSSGFHENFVTVIKLFTNALYVMSLVGAFFFAMAWIINANHLPSRAKEAGWSEDQGAMLLTVFAVFGILTRMTHGWFVDRGYIGSFQLQFGCIAGSALATFLNPVSDGYGFLVSCSVLLGAFTGIGAPLIIVIVKSLVCEAQIPSALSWLFAVFFIALGTGSLVAGKLYDATGNYTATFLSAGAIFVASLVLFVLVFVLKRRQRDPAAGVPDKVQHSRCRQHEAPCTTTHSDVESQ
ncbi:monocarboxylate transporter 13-like [Acanthaster planci]|uniref:Monocarboxylate transporter 13-like n=1 Tax=Acanthaster planci TaxID=133434 RepID=A0A8B7YNC2_ACAPL|nr:monocarboxylate transporter 13-like [Acanthaster planci]XP_022094768.1 monocarboxylate transporter 13-like [Acanthaster planci]XP_022094769.1 monocarboxylate transporter 13-like [Acanthaster planci]XP_022094771.1 monocarboxylate transporter 13-like [Acanthaster planci]